MGCLIFAHHYDQMALVDVCQLCYVTCSQRNANYTVDSVFCSLMGLCASARILIADATEAWWCRPTRYGTNLDLRAQRCATIHACTDQNHEVQRFSIDCI